MSRSKQHVFTSILIIALGGAWLLNTIDVLPGVNWVWTAGLGVMGIFVLASGINKLTGVIGPFLMMASVLSVLRQTGRLRVDIEMPILFMLIGILMLLVHLLRLKTPEFLHDEQPEKKS